GEHRLPVPAERLGQHGLRAVLQDHLPLRDEVRDTGHQQHDAIERRRHRRVTVTPRPGGHERHQREPEQQVHVRPHDRAVDALARVQQVVMVVPVDGDVDEAQDVARQDGRQLTQRCQVRALRHLQLEHHDRDDDGDHPVAEGFHPFGSHVAPRVCLARGRLTVKRRRRKHRGRRVLERPEMVWCAPMRANVYRVHGMMQSYFTRKMTGYFDYKGIPWLFRRFPGASPAAMAAGYPGGVPVVETPDGEFMWDSTSMIHHLELRFPEPAVLPTDSVQRFLCYVLEDAGDEWLYRPAVGSRWHFPENAAVGGYELARDMAVRMPI